MRSVAAGDVSARREAVRRLLPRAQRLCQALLRNSADAKDASQSGIIEVLRSAGTFRGESSLDHWADRIVARGALRLARAERRSYGLPFWARDDQSAVFDSGNQLLAKECLERLSEVQRTAVVLRCGFEYSIDEIAELTAVSPNTVKDRILSARRTIRRLVHREPSHASPLEEDADTVTVPVPFGTSPKVPKP